MPSSPPTDEIQAPSPPSSTRPPSFFVEIPLPSTASSSSPSFYLPPPSGTREPFRDISFLGPITLHRFFVILYLVGVMVGLYYLQELIWPATSLDNLHLWISSPYLGVIWLVSLPTCVASLCGTLWFRHNTKLDDIPSIRHNVAFRIVSRGNNRDVLLETVQRCHTEMKRNPMFPYLVEVVTDGDVFKISSNDPTLTHLKVPADFTTPNQTKFKARALHYACEHSLLPPDTWIVHLDEETQPTSSGIKGIAQFVQRCETEGDLNRIGQGSILYHRAMEKYPFLTLADMRRTGDDFGHYYLQHRIGFTLFGLHGAFIVARQDMEARVGFDLGPDGSITEDAWWVLIAMKMGYRTAWIDGYLEEQSTQSIMDFLKQRRRWFYGLSKVVLRCPVELKYRLFVGYSTFSWLFVPFLLPIQLLYMIVLWVYHIPVALPVRLLTNFIVAISSLVYMSGLVCNMKEHGTKWWQTPFWIIAMIILMPFCLLLEVFSVFMAFFAGCTQNGKGFHVVEKSANAVQADSDSEQSATPIKTNDDDIESQKDLPEQSNPAITTKL